MKKTTSERDPEAFEKLQDLVHDIDVAMMTTVTPDGALRSRPMVTADFNDDGEIWFFTADDSGKTRDLAEEHAVNLSYADPKRQRYVSVTGSATITHDADRAKELWKSKLKIYFPGGAANAHLALLCVRIETAEFWDVPTSKMIRLLGGAKNHAERDGDDDAHHVKVDVRATPASG